MSARLRRPKGRRSMIFSRERSSLALSHQEADLDILNPVQTLTADLHPEVLRALYGNRITFQGGVDTRRVPPFGMPDEVRALVRERIHVVGSGGGHGFNPIHHVQAGVPVVSLLALYDAVRECRTYPVA